jgi:hypothetical protein
MTWWAICHSRQILIIKAPGRDPGAYFYEDNCIATFTVPGVYVGISNIAERNQEQLVLRKLQDLCHSKQLAATIEEKREHILLTLNTLFSDQFITDSKA